MCTRAYAPLCVVKIVIRKDKMPAKGCEQKCNIHKSVVKVVKLENNTKIKEFLEGNIWKFQVLR